MGLDVVTIAQHSRLGVCRSHLGLAPPEEGRAPVAEKRVGVWGQFEGPREEQGSCAVLAGQECMVAPRLELCSV